MSENILDLRYFGSVVRSDQDKSSDVDILCVTRDGMHVNRENVTAEIDPQRVMGRHVDISYYGHERLQQMWLMGHLFAWHIYYESQPVSERYTFICDLGEPQKYRTAHDDVVQLTFLCEEIKISLVSGSNSLIYDAGLLYVAARNIGISASWYSDKKLNFSRFAPFTLVFNGEDCCPKISMETYSMLSRARHASMRGIEAPLISRLDLIDICDKLQAWSVQVIKKIEAFV